MSAQNQRGEENAQAVRLAQFRVLGPGAAGTPIDVHFNPESLEYTVTNNIKEQGNSTENKQQVSKSSGKLSMELVFDTTLDGSDVREKTEELQSLMKPVEEGGKKIAPVVEFAWGTYRFRGIFSSYKETLDFFSATGVPLRASVSLSMTQQDGLFDPTAKGDAAPIDNSQAFAPPGNENNDDPTGKGPVTGDPQTDRGLAEDNGEENPRFFSGKSLRLPSGPDLQPAVAFASGGLSLGLSAGLNIGFSAGVSAGIGIGIGIEAGIDVGLSASFEIDIGIDIGFEAKIEGSASASASGIGASSFGGTSRTSGGGSAGSGLAGGARTSSGRATTGLSSGSGDLDPSTFGGFGGGEFVRSGPGAPVRTRTRGAGSNTSIDDTLDALPLGPRFGGLAAAGMPAALGAFAGLRPVPPRRRRPILLSELQGHRPERDLRTDAGATFAIGGQAIDRVSRGLSADVGARASLSDRISFDDTVD